VGSSGKTYKNPLHAPVILLFIYLPFKYIRKILNYLKKGRPINCVGITAFESENNGD
jgi:hypothetical protein